MLLSTKAEGVSFSVVNCITASRGLIQSCEIQEVISVGLARMDLGLLQGVAQLQGGIESMVCKLFNSIVDHHSKYKKCLISLNN